MLRTSYPRVYKKTHALKSFEAARQLEGLDEETLLSILELEQLYRSELDATNTRIRRAIDRHQPGEARRSIEQIGVAMLGQSMDLGD